MNTQFYRDLAAGVLQLKIFMALPLIFCNQTGHLKTNEQTILFFFNQERNLRAKEPQGQNKAN